jgi:hypothetical protein
MRHECDPLRNGIDPPCGGEHVHHQIAGFQSKPFIYNALGLLRYDPWKLLVG